MRCPRVCADSISAKVESPATLIDSSGSIWTATVNGMRFSGSSIELLACYADKSPDPRILDMAGARARRQQDHVAAYVVARPGIARHEDLGRRGAPRQAALVDREVELGGAGASLALDECNEVALARDEIDFAGWRAHAAVEDSPAFEAQPPPGSPLAAPARSFGGLAVTRHCAWPKLGWEGI